jgi:hypothetical protein
LVKSDLRIFSGGPGHDYHPTEFPNCRGDRCRGDSYI